MPFLKKLTKEKLFYNLLLFTTLMIAFVLIKQEKKRDFNIIKNGIKTTGHITKYVSLYSKGSSGNIDFVFFVDNKKFLSFKQTTDIFPTCEKDSICIGRKFAVYYLPENPKKHHVPVFEEEIKF
jgi:hypothetical protein